MRFKTTTLPGVFLIELEPHSDERGFLARSFCAEEFQRAGLNTHWPQCNTTLTRRKGMIRGLHYQAEPHSETKLIHCTAGAVWDVVADVRPESATFGRWEKFELAAGDLRQLYVPAGFAHGFQCLEDDSRLFYQMSASYQPGLARGVRWNDPDLKIPWPIQASELSEPDRNLPSLRPA
jgi:dTDP-4-dehydrorhamnose 3,5-epimerase